jgi:hypothetical protein
VKIAAKYNGPPSSGNGGYTSGLVASYVDAPIVEVTLRRPPPLETELTVKKGERVQVFHGDNLVAEAVPASLNISVPAVSYEDAVAASQSYSGFSSHPFPTCYVCGPERSDGLRVFPGRLDDGRTAAPFVAPNDISPVLVWAALDCPGGWTVAQEERLYVLGQMAAQVQTVPAPGQECVVVGDLVGEVGRKAQVRTSLYSTAGELLATARATWICIE